MSLKQEQPVLKSLFNKKKSHIQQKNLIREVCYPQGGKAHEVTENDGAVKGRIGVAKHKYLIKYRGLPEF